jgi:RNA polymerase primary sigma factor
VKKLVSEGRRRGYLTLDDVNGALPEEVLSTDQLHEVLALFGEHEITVVDSQRPRATKKVQEGRSRADFEGEEAPGTNDPVRVYLREMGQVSLLSREGEVEIAMRIEAGEHKMLYATVGNAYGVREVLRLGDQLRKNKIEPKAVLDGLDDPEAEHTPEERRRMLLQTLTRIRRLEGEISKRNSAIANPRTSDETRKHLQEEVEARYRRNVDLLLEARFSGVRLVRISAGFQKVAREMRELQREAERAARPFKVDSSEFERLAVLSTRRSKKGKEVLERLGGDPARIAAVLEKIQEIQKTLRKRESEIRMDRGAVREAIRRYREASRPAPGRVDRQEIHEPRPPVPGPDSGRQHRPDEGGGQVRVSARLQVLDLCHLVDSTGDHPGDRRSGADDPDPRAHDRDDQQAPPRREAPRADARPRAVPRGARREAGDASREGADGAQDCEGAHQSRDPGRRTR